MGVAPLGETAAMIRWTEGVFVFSSPCSGAASKSSMAYAVAPLTAPHVKLSGSQPTFTPFVGVSKVGLGVGGDAGTSNDHASEKTPCSPRGSMAMILQ